MPTDPPGAEMFTTEDQRAIDHAAELLDLHDRLVALHPVQPPQTRPPSEAKAIEILAWDALREAALRVAEARPSFIAPVPDDVRIRH